MMTIEDYYKVYYTNSDGRDVYEICYDELAVKKALEVHKDQDPFVVEIKR